MHFFRKKNKQINVDLPPPPHPGLMQPDYLQTNSLDNEHLESAQSLGQNKLSSRNNHQSSIEKVIPLAKMEILFN